jgi:hypothetical protein
MVNMVYFVCIVSRRESGAENVTRKSDMFASLSAALKKSLRIRPLTQGEDRLTVGLRHRPVRVAWCARLGAGLGFLYPPVLGVRVWLLVVVVRPFWAGGGGCLSHPDALTRAIEGDGGVAMFMAVSAGAAASGAACTSVGDRSMRNEKLFTVLIREK